MRLNRTSLLSILFFLVFTLLSQWVLAFSFNIEKPHQTPANKLLSVLQAGPFSLVPYGNLPTRVVTGGTVTAYYTVTNATAAKTFSNCQVQTVPHNTTLITSGSGICGRTFTLSAQESCRVALSVSGSVNNLPPLFVCTSDGISCTGNGSYPLNVTAVNVTSLTIAPTNYSMEKGQATDYTATIRYSDGVTEDVTNSVTWSSSQTNVANISSTGAVVAQSVGSTVISASIYGVTTSTNLTVTPPTLSSIAVTPSYALLEIAQTLPYSATATYSDGTTADVTSLVSWASSDTSKATISSAGLATGVAVGETTISATLDGVVGRTGLTVTGADLQSVTVQPSTASSPAGVPYHFTATAHYDDGTSYNVTEAATWTSSNTTYATVETLGDEE